MTSAINPIEWLPEAGAPVAPLGASAQSAASDFTGLLKSGATALSEQAGQASELLSAYAVGENVSPHELVMAMEQAKLSLQLAVEVRNRLVDAYQELTRLQI
ncbi:flagellar hook-basal body protein FliE [Pseudomonas sp. LLC-1]|uniref:flagellar hook-basal body complex protein FliE n=1 Tax=Pseudomonas sp. LLC-1 TaxID=1812180 RepID=UPI000D011D63|nr:flagellar hook-basal body complex protein FliE [Pseudomonas sp. LLC-1]PRN03000.1 flagellar hook-basal body protein FliE [Pseudomonas sp. LLC-1]